jgi:hypothetical protein
MSRFHIELLGANAFLNLVYLNNFSNKFCLFPNVRKFYTFYYVIFCSGVICPHDIKFIVLRRN